MNKKLKQAKNSKQQIRENLLKFLTFVKKLTFSKGDFCNLMQFHHVFITIIVKTFELKDVYLSFVASTVLKQFIAYPLENLEKLERKN